MIKCLDKTPNFPGSIGLARKGSKENIKQHFYNIKLGSQAIIMSIVKCMRSVNYDLISPIQNGIN